MVVLRNGDIVPAAGWYVDGHGHRLFLQHGHLAPLCPQLGPVPVRWQPLTPLIPPPVSPPSED